MLMTNQGTLTFLFRTVDGSPFADPDVVIEVKDQNQTIGRLRQAVPPPVPKIAVSAFPQSKLLVSFAEGRRFRRASGAPFTILDGQSLPQVFVLFRKPSAWTADFVPWRKLGAHFDQLKWVLQRSPDLRVRRCRECDTFRSLTGDTYDDIDPAHEKLASAKAGLLNLFAGFTCEKEPVQGRKPWFDFIQRVLEIGRDRLIAVVDPKLSVHIETIKQSIDAFPTYRHSYAQNHWPNVKHYGVTKSSMRSVKTKEQIGNLQLTVGRGIDPASGSDAWILDADIDENGEWVKHATDVFKHKITGGTHPFDVHECLCATRPNLSLGYSLV
jgi:hypothetical protein